MTPICYNPHMAFEIEKPLPAPETKPAPEIQRAPERPAEAREIPRPAPERKKQEPAPPAPTPVAPITPAVTAKDDVEIQIEAVLAEDLGDVYRSMSEKERAAFKKQGE